MHSTTSEKESVLVHLLLEGSSLHNTAQKVGISVATASCIAKRLLPDHVACPAGCPPLLSKSNKRKVVCDITSGTCTTAVDVAERLAGVGEVGVSVKTVQRVLKEAGLCAGPKTKKPLLTKKHIQGCMAFCLAHKDWTVEDWKRVVWSDEITINCLGSDGRLWCWKRKGEKLSTCTTQATVKYGGGSLMVWGCMTYNGVGYLRKVEGHMNAIQYCKILQEDLVASMRWYGLKHQDVLFQQDNDPKHNSKKAKICLEELGFVVMEWPSNSPDLNPIEHLWRHLKQQMNCHKRHPKSMHELWELVSKEWDYITDEVCRKLVDSMPCRIHAILAAKGGATKY
jgi:transposase